MMKWLEMSVVLFLLSVIIIKCSAMSLHELEDFTNFLEKTSRLDQNIKKGPIDPNDEDGEEEIVSDHAWEDSGKFEGDLILNERQRRLIVENVAEGLSRNGLKDGTKRWPNNEVIYYIQKEHFSSDQVQAIQDGIDDLGQASCVKFRPYKKGDKDAVVIQGSRRGCFSQVGYQGGYQVLNLSGRHPVGRGCFRHGTVVHELLHTLGFYHMQSSPDRDDYIDVAWENIIERARHNFRKYNAFSVSDFGVGYDYDSVLHYSRRAFSANGRDTLIPKKDGAEIGQRVGLSDKDTQKLNKMYCDADSDNSNADEDTTHKLTTKKKNSKNKPFEGHGIGYHQGKTVVIKLPAAETYQLPDLPSYHVFDYFSKAPQAMSPTLIEGFEIGKEIGYTYKLPVSLGIEEYEKPAKPNTELQEKSIRDEKKLEPVQSEKELTKSFITELYDGKIKVSENNKDSNSHTDKSTVNSDKIDDDLSDAFDRLGKIIKTHVYPSQTPNLDIYKVQTAYSNYHNPEKDFENESYKESEDEKVTKYLLSREFLKRPYGPGDYSSLQEKKYGDVKKSNTPVNVLTPLRPLKEMYNSLFGLSYPIKYQQEENNKQSVIPEYASLNHIQNKDNYSNLYNPKIKSYYGALFGNNVPLYDSWYSRDDLKQVPEKINKDTLKYSLTDRQSNINVPTSFKPQSESNSKEEYHHIISAKRLPEYTTFPLSVTQSEYKIKDYKQNLQHEDKQYHKSGLSDDSKSYSTTLTEDRTQKPELQSKLFVTNNTSDSDQNLAINSTHASDHFGNEEQVHPKIGIDFVSTNLEANLENLGQITDSTQLEHETLNKLENEKHNVKSKKKEHELISSVKPIPYEVTEKVEEMTDKVPTKIHNENAEKNNHDDDYSIFQQSINDRLSTILQGYTKLDDFDISSPYDYQHSDEISDSSELKDGY